LFTVGKTVLGIYLARTSVVSIYGAGGSIVAFLIWIYYSSQILIFGAELIQARRTRKEWMG
jgi:membrane protein